GETVGREERLLQELHERIRDVRQGPDGALWLATDNANGRILRGVPARERGPLGNAAKGVFAQRRMNLRRPQGRWSPATLTFFASYRRPTAVPEHPEPPADLVAFLWHFARQAKVLFIALFVVEFFVALTDSAVPWFMGRIVTLVTTIPPDRFLGES